jgi:hypothetical protein
MQSFYTDGGIRTHLLGIEPGGRREQAGRYSCI